MVPQSDAMEFAPRKIRSPFAASLLALALPLALGACSAADEGSQDSAADSADPPGTAQALSIGRQVVAEGEGAFEISVNCAAAIGLTAEKLAQMTSNPRSRELAIMARAEDFFEAQAKEAQAELEGSASSPAAAIARRRSENADSTTEQAQLAMSCLRQFGDQVGA